MMGADEPMLYESTVSCTSRPMKVTTYTNLRRNLASLLDAVSHSLAEG